MMGLAGRTIYAKLQHAPLMNCSIDSHAYARSQQATWGVAMMPSRGPVAWAAISTTCPLLRLLLAAAAAATAAAAASLGATEAAAGIAAVRKAIGTCGGDAACVARAAYGDRVAAALQGLANGIEVREESDTDAYASYLCNGMEAEDAARLVPEPLATEAWAHEDDFYMPVGEAGCSRREMRVDKLFESPRGHASVYLAHGFISPEECGVLRDRAGSLVRAGTYKAMGDEDEAAAQARVGRDGKVERAKTFSDARKARANTIEANATDPGDAVAALQARVFAFANRYRPGGEAFPPLERVGQEPVNVIEYASLGDEYTLHCDTYCDGSSLLPQGRVATVVMYCDEPTRGGATVFPFIDMAVQGRAGQAVLFHYRGEPDAAPLDRGSWRGGGVVDSGFTQHTGCPLLEGRKLIATQWMRAGVSEAEPWWHFSGYGVPLPWARARGRGQGIGS